MKDKVVKILVLRETLIYFTNKPPGVMSSCHRLVFVFIFSGNVQTFSREENGRPRVLSLSRVFFVAHIFMA